MKFLIPNGAQLPSWNITPSLAGLSRGVGFFLITPKLSNIKSIVILAICNLYFYRAVWNDYNKGQHKIRFINSKYNYVKLKWQIYYYI